MAIANTTESEPPAIILAVVHSTLDFQTDLERKIKLKDLTILQKKQLDCNLEEIQPWFEEEVNNSSENETTGYVLQGEAATDAWQDLSIECSQNKCGTATEADLQRFFPGIVLEKYLLQPEWALMFLSQLKPVIMSGLRKMCEEKPKDPIEFLINYLDSSRESAAN